MSRILRRMRLARPHERKALKLDIGDEVKINGKAYAIIGVSWEAERGYEQVTLEPMEQWLERHHILDSIFSPSRMPGL